MAKTQLRRAFIREMVIQIPTLAFLADPVFLFLLATGVGWLLWRRFRVVGNIFVVCAAISLYALSTPLVGARLLHLLESEPPTASAVQAQTPRAIVVLSAGLAASRTGGGADTVGPLTLERIRIAARLHHDTGLPILVSGGVLRGGSVSVASAMEDALTTDFRVPVRWVEDASRNTYENAQFSAAILRRANIRTSYLVTHGWHMPRAHKAFEGTGLNVVSAPAGFTPVGSGIAPSDLIPRTRALAMSAYALHELVGGIWYAIAYD